MSNLLLHLGLFFIVLSLTETQAKEVSCYCGASNKSISWVEEDGSLVFPKYRIKDGKYGEILDDSEENSYGDDISGSCTINVNTSSLKCTGKGIKTLPSPKNMTLRNLKEYIISSASLFPLPPSSFKNLNIIDLIIQNSSLTFMSDDVFDGLKSLSTLTISGNKIANLNEIDEMFRNLPSIKAIYFENNQLRNMNCATNDNTFLENLEFLSLANNPLSLVNFQCLNQSRLIYLNLRGVDIDDNEAKSMRFSLLPTTLTTVDFSSSKISLKALDTILYMLDSHNITKLSLASLSLLMIPLDSLKFLNDTLQYLSLSGNHFNDNSFYSRMESINVQFKNLLELDLRSCKIEAIDLSLLCYFPNLEKLSLANNKLHTLDSNLLTFSSSLNYLDISENSENLVFCYNDTEVQCTDNGVFTTENPIFTNQSTFVPIASSENFTNKIYSFWNNFTNTTPILRSLNSQKNITSSLQTLILTCNHFEPSQTWFSFNQTLQLLTKLKVLSLCGSILNVNTLSSLSILSSLTTLDLSYILKNNPEYDLIPAFQNLFPYLKNLQELYFAENDFKFDENSVSMFTSLQSLSLLNLSGNAIYALQDKMFSNLTNLKNLILKQNNIRSWNSRVFPKDTDIHLVDLSENQITLVTNGMVEDFMCVTRLNLKKNPFICDSVTNNLICGAYQNKSTHLTIVDWEQYTCLDKNEYKSYNNGSTLCSAKKNASGSSSDNQQGSIIFMILVPVCVIAFIIVGIVAKTKWQYIRQYITLAKKSSTCNLLKNTSSSINDHRFVYDVFVSYSDIDRAWVLDYLIPNIEKQDTMSVCFHERDFQVGLSILENIVECMAKSRCLLLVISESFVKSKWCQFEMHLAQHHAVETKKEQLVMVLLENIPKQNRPKTLHHLMCTRTYLIWPQQPSKDDMIELFWKRLYRAIKHENNVTPVYVTV